MIETENEFPGSFIDEMDPPLPVGMDAVLVNNTGKYGRDLFDLLPAFFQFIFCCRKVLICGRRSQFDLFTFGDILDHAENELMFRVIFRYGMDIP